MHAYLNCVGLCFTFVGASLLFVHGYLQVRTGDVIVRPGEVLTLSDPGGPETSRDEWEALANRLTRRGHMMNIGGFALVAIGTL